MRRLAYIKTYLFRFLAIVLLALSAGFIVAPESNPYSTDKTFVKAHAPTADNFGAFLKADDKEDMDEDGTLGVQLSHDFSVELISWVAFTDDYKIQAKPLSKRNSQQFYLVHRQLLI
ncbi:MAG TPA: hypothetical protein VGQ59_02580 [Cyclobacteriaceae bacterium]|nr:hypothetical protein [Cyclobacteriaceae bacterium]